MGADLTASSLITTQIRSIPGNGKKLYLRDEIGTRGQASFLSSL